jgi:hypothetical protein
MFLALQLFSINAKRPSFQRRRFNMAYGTFPRAEIAVLMDTEGESPLELALGIVHNGQLIDTKRWLCAPVATSRGESWGIRNLHGIDFEQARVNGLSRDNLKTEVAAWLAENITERHRDGLINVYVPGSVGGGDRRLYEALNIPYFAEPTAIELDRWVIRIAKPYHQYIYHPNATLCPPTNHYKYNPDIFKLMRRGCQVSETSWAKLGSGYHCAVNDVVELYRFMKDKQMFESDFPLC